MIYDFQVVLIFLQELWGGLIYKKSKFCRSEANWLFWWSMRTLRNIGKERLSWGYRLLKGSEIQSDYNQKKMDIQIPALDELKETPNYRVWRKVSHRQKGTREQVVGNYRIGKKIGNGSYGKVYEAVHLLTQAKVIVKVLPTHRQTPDAPNNETLPESPKVDERVEAEIAIQQSLDHPNIAKIFDVVRTDQFVYIFMEYCQKGELFDFLRADGPLTHEMAGKVFYQIFSAVKYIHEMGIAHRDIKAENIVFDQDMNAKLIDFGLAKNYGESGNKEKLKTFCGSPSYNPPEIVKKRRYNGQLADVWSLGVTLYAMLEASLPFDSENPKACSYNISNQIWHCPESSPDEAIELYKAIFTPMSKRFTLEEIEQSSYFLRYCCPKDKTSSPRLPHILKDSQILTERAKTIEAKRKPILDFSKTPQTHRKVSMETSRKGRKHVESIEHYRGMNEEANFRIRFTPKKVNRKRQEKLENFFLKPHLIEP